MILLQNQRLVVPLGRWIESNASVDKSVFTSLVVFEGLATDLLLAVNETIFVPVVIEIQFA